MKVGFNSDLHFGGGQIDADVPWDLDFETSYNRTTDVLAIGTAAALAAGGSFVTAGPELTYDLDFLFDVYLNARVGVYVDLEVTSIDETLFNPTVDIDQTLALIDFDSTTSPSFTLDFPYGISGTLEWPNLEVSGIEGALGSYSGSGSSNNFITVNLDADQLAADVLLGGANPFDLSADLGVAGGSLELVDVDVFAGLNFLQNFTLQAGGLSSTMIFEDGSSRAFTFGDELIFTDASGLDANNDGNIDFTIDMSLLELLGDQRHRPRLQRRLQFRSAEGRLVVRRGGRERQRQLRTVRRPRRQRAGRIGRRLLQHLRPGFRGRGVLAYRLRQSGVCARSLSAVLVEEVLRLGDDAGRGGVGDEVEAAVRGADDAQRLRAHVRGGAGKLPQEQEGAAVERGHLADVVGVAGEGEKGAAAQSGPMAAPASARTTAGSTQEMWMWRRSCDRPAFELIASPIRSGGAARSSRPTCQPWRQNSTTGGTMARESSMPVTSTSGTISQAKGLAGSSSLMTTNPCARSTSVQSGPGASPRHARIAR